MNIVDECDSDEDGVKVPRKRRRTPAEDNRRRWVVEVDGTSRVLSIGGKYALVCNICCVRCPSKPICFHQRGDCAVTNEKACGLRLWPS